MKYWNSHVSSLLKPNDDSACLIGFAGGRVNFSPKSKYLYSLRIFIFFLKLEILWTTGETDDSTVTL